MSTFKVKLTQGDKRTGDGNLDTQAQSSGTSVQRTMFAMGPGKINRKLKDGDTFIDCNYWKRFTYPTIPYNEAFIEVVSDDGSVYVDGKDSTSVKTYTKALLTATTHTTANNILDVVGDNGGPFKWASITTDRDVTVRINGVAASDFVVALGTTHTFNNGDVLISRLTFANASGSTANVVVTGGVSIHCAS